MWLMELNKKLAKVKKVCYNIRVIIINKMNKRTLIQLGKMCAVIDVLFKSWVDSKYADKDISQKMSLTKHVKKQVEEQARGNIKSKIDYAGMAQYIIDNFESNKYQELHKGVTDIALTKK